MSLVSNISSVITQVGVKIKDLTGRVATLEAGGGGGVMPSRTVSSPYTITASDVGTEIVPGVSAPLPSPLEAVVNVDASVLAVGDVIYVRNASSMRLRISAVSGTSIASGVALGDAWLTQPGQRARLVCIASNAIEAGEDAAQYLPKTRVLGGQNLSYPPPGGFISSDTANGTLTIRSATDATAPIAYPVGGSIVVRQGAAGKITFAAGSGVTLLAPNGNSTNGLNDFRVLLQVAQDVWMVC